MRFVYSNPELERAIADANTLEELNTAFVRLSELVPSFLAPEIRGRQMFCPELDKQAARLPGRLGLADIAAEKSNDNVCIVATRFYGTGGHSKVASDIARLIGAERTTIVFTDLYSQLRERDLPNMAASVYPRRALIRLSAGTLVEKVLELQASKRDLADAILNADQGALGRIGREELELLLG